MRTNVTTKCQPSVTHEGATASRINAYQSLRRSVLACMLFEDALYEDGQSTSERIASGVAACKPAQVSALAIEARTQFKLRHVPLFLAREMVRHPSHRPFVADTLAEIIQRPDELGEFLSIYFKEAGESKRNSGKGQPIPAQVKKGLARAFQKFSEYALAKYNHDAAVKLRDVLFLTHAKPKDAEQADLWKRLIAGTLAVPDTWEVELSSSKDKKASWERLLKENKLGALALLRNLRNMKEAKVDEAMVGAALQEMKTERMLPFRFIAAANHAPQWESELEGAMFRCLASFDKLPGKTAIVVDNSGSMLGPKISAKSELDRSDAACALAMLVRETCERCVVIGFGNEAAIVPSRRGFALRDAIKRGPGGGTNTDNALALAESEEYDRIIVITDEQSHQAVRAPRGPGYFMNVATYKNGIGYGPWTHIDGFSEAVLDFIRESEREPQ